MEEMGEGRKRSERSKASEGRRGHRPRSFEGSASREGALCAQAAAAGGPRERAAPGKVVNSPLARR